MGTAYSGILRRHMPLLVYLAGKLKRFPYLICQVPHNQECGYTLLLKPSNSTLKASETESQTSKPAERLKFAKGRDGATYIDAIAPGGSADKTGKFSVGDKIWPASEYGRTMYTIRQRIGPLLMKMQKEIRNAKYEEALEKFESVLGSKPDLTEASVAGYYVACRYLKLNQLQAGLSALEDALEAVFEDFKGINQNLRNHYGGFIQHMIYYKGQAILSFWKC
ncbi:hypothetical protein Peur_004417 [Populus x canadensis]